MRVNTTIYLTGVTELSRHTLWRGELRDRKARKGRELSLQREHRERERGRVRCIKIV